MHFANGLYVYSVSCVRIMYVCFMCTCVGLTIADQSPVEAFAPTLPQFQSIFTLLLFFPFLCVFNALAMLVFFPFLCVFNALAMLAFFSSHVYASLAGNCACALTLTLYSFTCIAYVFVTFLCEN